jgi:hypothetical protein
MQPLVKSMANKMNADIFAGVPKTLGFAIFPSPPRRYYEAARIILRDSLSEPPTLIGVGPGLCGRRRKQYGAEVRLPRRGIMTPPIGYKEAKDRGFLEEALAHPGG